MGRVSFVVLFLAVRASLSAQSLTTVLLPKYIEGVNGTNSNRIPFVYRVRLNGLHPNATYRYFNQVVISSDAATTSGAGNCLFASATGDFVRTTSPSLGTAGGYGTFATDATGSHEGWFASEPTGNARFFPGRYVFMRIMLNDGGSGTTIASRLTMVDSVRVVRLSPAPTDTTGTALRCPGGAGPKDFVLAYDNMAGTGRPVTGSFIESDGTANTTANSYAAFYANSVNGIDGAFGVVLPNALPNGIRRFERRSLSTGGVVAFATDADGTWPSGASTVNPGGGTTEIVLTGTDVSLTTGVRRPGGRPEHAILSQNYPNPFNPVTNIEYQISHTSHVTLKVFDVLGREVATLVDEIQEPGPKSVQFSTRDESISGGDARNLASGTYFYRLQTGGFVETRKLLVLR